MENDKLYTCCFFGHRKIKITNTLIGRLNKVIEKLIARKRVNTFLFGSKSEFNTLCLKIVTDFKEKYPYIKRVYVRAEYPYINNEYEEYLLEGYDDTYYPERIINAGKAAYIERNCEMIDKSAWCVVYYDKDYTPVGRKKSRLGHQSNSGTKIAYNYAEKRCKNIINVNNKF